MLQNVETKSILPSSPRFYLKTVATTFALALALLGCTKKTELGSQVVVQLPIAAGQTEYKPSHFDKIRKIEAMSELSWGLTRPSSLAETRCFAVVVEIPAAERESGSLLPGSNTTKTCTSLAGTNTIYVHQFAGLAAAGSQIEINMAPGSSRKFHLFAFSAESAGECTLTEAGSLIRKASLSGPLHIGSATADIVSGVNNVEIVASYASGLAYENCEWTEPPPLVGGAFQINAGATHTRLTSVNLTPSLPFVASQAFYTLDPTCRTGGSWESYSPTRTGFVISTGDGPKTVYARYRDSAGSTSSCLQASILLDQTIPAVNINTPPDSNINMAGAYTFSGTCSEEGTPVTWTLGSLNGTQTCISSSFFVGPLNITSIADGTVTLTATQTDIAGNVGTMPRTILKDTVAPAIMITSPAPGSFVNSFDQAAFPVTGTCSENAQQVFVRVDGSVFSSVACAGGTFSATLSLNAISEGGHSIEAEISDAVGNLSSTSSVVTKDTVAPMAFIDSPAPSIHLNPMYTTTISGTDVVSYRWKNVGNPVDCANPGGYMGPFGIATPINQPTPTPQLHVICVIGTDVAGNEQPTAAATTTQFTQGPVIISFVDRWTSQPDSVGARMLGITISPPLSAAATLSIEAQGTALFGTNFTGFSSGMQTTSIPPGVSSHSILVSVIGSSISLTEKRLAVTLSGSTIPGIQIGEIDTHQVWIEDSVSPMSPFTKVAVGPSSACGLNATGAIYCWGSDASGQIGDGAGVTSQTSPVRIDGAFTYADVAVGNGYACGVRTSGQLYCWGSNSSGELGDGTSTTRWVPTAVATGSTFIKVATYMSTTCAITSANELMCWGSKSYGQVADGTSSGTQLTPYPVDPVSTYTDVAMGWNHGCALRSTGVVYCWGRGDLGQIGNGFNIDATTPTEVLVLSGITSIYAGQFYSCAINSAQKAFCWGEGAQGKLGNGAVANSNTPVPAQSTLNFASLSLGANTTCGIETTNNTLRCWGYSYYGLLGNGSRGNLSHTAQTAILPNPVTQVSSNGTAICSVAAGKGFCWGSPQNTHLGHDAAVSVEWSEPKVNRNYQSVALGRGGCGINVSGNLSCWGPNDIDNLSTVGQVGDGSSVRRVGAMIVDSGMQYQSVQVGTQHSCGISTTGTLKCWGLNSTGQLGIGNTITQSTPTVVGGPYIDAAVGLGSTCAINVSNQLQCWGQNTYGQLGLGNNTNYNTPQLVSGLGAVTKVSVGAGHACALNSTNELFCWGRNDWGQVGDGTLDARDSAVQIAGAWSSVSAGAYVTCALNMSNELLCWGRNADGELGQGSTVPDRYSAPTVVNSGTTYTHIAVGSSTSTSGPGTHVCAITAMQGLQCWGSNRKNQNAYPAAPFQVLTPTAVDAFAYSFLAVGEQQTCARRTSGVWLCRGSTQENHLPNGMTATFPQMIPRVRF